MNEKYKKIAELSGIPEKDVAMHMKLMEQALDGNVEAYNQIMEIAYGKEEKSV